MAEEQHDGGVFIGSVNLDRGPPCAEPFFQIMEVKMSLIPNEIEAILPLLYSQENVPDPAAVVKFFDPCGRYTSTFWRENANPTAISCFSDSASQRSGRAATSWGMPRSESWKAFMDRSGWASNATSTSNRRRSRKSEVNREKEVIELGK
jgi:hypothetical protein